MRAFDERDRFKGYMILIKLRLTLASFLAAFSASLAAPSGLKSALAPPRTASSVSSSSSRSESSSASDARGRFAGRDDDDVDTVDADGRLGVWSVDAEEAEDRVATVISR